MKKLILLLQFIVCFVSTKAQTPNWLWGEPEYSDGDGYCSGLALGPNDTLYMVGREGGSITMGGINLNPGGTYPFIAKLDTNYPANPNNAAWINVGLNTGFDYTYGICSDKENNVYTTGDENSGNSAYVIKINNVGAQVGSNNTGVQNGQGYGVVVDNSENIYETGNYDGNPQFGTNPPLPYGGSQWAGFLVKFDSSLNNAIWSTYFDATDGSNQNYTTGKSVALDLQGNVYVVGSYQGAGMFYSANGGPTIAAPVMVDGNGGNSGDLFVAKYDSSGTVQWVIAAANAGMDPNSWGYGNKIKVDSCGNLYVAGYFENTATFGNISVTCTATRDMFVAKFNTKSMVWEWVETGLGNGSTYATDIALDKTSDVYVVGSYTAPATFNDTVLSTGANFIAKYANSNGALQWLQSCNISGQSAGVSGVVVDGDNYCYIDGTYSGPSSTLGTTVTLPNAPGGSGFIAKLDTVPPRAIIPVLDSSYCPGSTFYIPYSIIGTFNPGNVFTAQLSDSSGSFNTPENIGDTTTVLGGSVKVTIPNGTIPGTTYLIRITSSTPPTSSYVNGCGYYYSQGVYVNDFYITIGAGGNIPVTFTALPGTTICSGTSDTVTVHDGTSYVWTSNGNSTDSTIIVSPTITTTYDVIVTKGTCVEDTSVVITVGTSTPLTILPHDTSICVGASVTLSVPSGTTYTWSPPTALSATTGNSVVANPTIVTVYTVNGAGSGGCTSLGTDTVFIVPAPLFYITPASAETYICVGSPITLTVSDLAGSNYVWSPASTLSSSTGDSVIATPLASTTTYTVTGKDGDGCNVSALDTVYTISGPNKPTISLGKDTLLTSTATQGNQWYREGVLINGATNETYAITDTGCYWTITVNPANGCSTVSDTLCVYSLTGINQLSIDPNQLSIYPNPTGGEVFINISSSVADVKDWNLQITDVLGRTVYTRISLNYSNDVDLSNLASGVYFITIIDNTARAVFPIVKQN